MTLAQVMAVLWLAALLAALLARDRVTRPAALRWSWVLAGAYVLLSYVLLLRPGWYARLWLLRELVLLGGLALAVVSLWPARWPGRLPRRRRARPGDQVSEALRQLDASATAPGEAPTDGLGVMRAIRTRRSVRSYQDRPVEADKLRAVLEAARLAPSARNCQPWRFVVVRDAVTRQRLAEVCGGGRFIAQAPVVIAAVGLTPERLLDCDVPGDPVDVAIAVDHMSLAAVELGLGTCWVGKYDQDKVRQLLDVPPPKMVIELLTLGYPADEPRERVRKTIEEIVCWERWT